LAPPRGPRLFIWGGGWGGKNAWAPRPPKEKQNPLGNSRGRQWAPRFFVPGVWVVGPPIAPPAKGLGFPPRPFLSIPSPLFPPNNHNTGRTGKGKKREVTWQKSLDVPPPCGAANQMGWGGGSPHPGPQNNTEGGPPSGAEFFPPKRKIFSPPWGPPRPRFSPPNPPISPPPGPPRPPGHKKPPPPRHPPKTALFRGI